MVLAERNADFVRNGRRSRGPSPNGTQLGANSAAGSAGAGAGTPENSSDDDNSMKRNGKKVKQSEYEEKIRVGRDYQAVCPPLIAEPERRPEIMNDRALLVWSPTKEIPDPKLEEYIAVAKEKYGYNGEQALGMLFWHKHDLERAILDLANFTPFPDEWTVEDKVLFDQAFQFHGKNFHRIRQMLPDKSIASLVKYYYSWKKTRHRQSEMDRQEKAKASKEGSENGSENGSNDESDDEKNDPNIANSNINNINSNSNNTIDVTAVASTSTATSNSHKKLSENINELDSESTNSANNANSSAAGGRNTPSGNNGNINGCCSNCGVACNMLCNSPDGKLCASCHDHWRRTGSKRPTSGPFLSKRHADRNKRKPPRGMNINHDELVILASDNGNDTLLANADKLFKTLQTQVQLEKQNTSLIKQKKAAFNADDAPPENTSRINPRWNHDEIMLAVQCMRKYGRDFLAVSEAIGTKTEANVRNFVNNNRRRYNIDQILQKFDDEKEAEEKAAKAASANDNKLLNGEPKMETVTSTGGSAVNNNNNPGAVGAAGQTILQIDLDAEQADLPPPCKKPMLSHN